MLRELELYAPLVSRGSYLVVLDTIIEDMPAHCFPDRPWGPGNNPKTVARAFLARTDRFEVDREREARPRYGVPPRSRLEALCAATGAQLEQAQARAGRLQEELDRDRAQAGGRRGGRRWRGLRAAARRLLRPFRASWERRGG
jgi:hypothetical protein